MATQQAAETSEGAVWATIIPSTPEEALLPLPEPWASPAVPGRILSTLGEAAWVPVFSAPAQGGCILYWVSRMCGEINERASRLVGVADVRGDAVLVSPGREPPAVVRRTGQRTSGSSGGSGGSDGRGQSTRGESGIVVGALGEAPSGKVERLGVSAISVLPQSLLERVFSELAFGDLSAAAAVCREWRVTVGDCEPLLSTLSIRRRPQFLRSHVPLPPSLSLRPARPALPAARGGATTTTAAGTGAVGTSGGGAGTGAGPASGGASSSRSAGEAAVAAGGGAGGAGGVVPFVLLRAAQAGNVEAMVLVADELEGARHQDVHGAFQWRKKAGKLGHQESQYRVGEAHYQGGLVARDPEEALVWLLRAARNPKAEAGVVARAALLLGYMHLDGDGLQRQDNTEAVRWLSVASSHGNKEAAETMGWLWNTGQY